MADGQSSEPRDPPEVAAHDTGPASPKGPWPWPSLPGTTLPRSAGLLLVLTATLGVEILQVFGVIVPAPAAVLLLVVAYATYLDGFRVGVIAGMIAVTYELYNLLWRGTVLTDTSSPVVRVAGLTLLTGLTVIFAGKFRVRLDALLATERRLLEEAESKRTELLAALTNVERAQGAVRFQARLLDALGQVVVATDLDGRILYLNGPASRLFGPRPIHRHSIMELMPEPAGRDTLGRIRRGEGGVGEVEVRRDDDTRVTVMFTDSPIRDDNEGVIGMVRIATDVTSRKHDERAQRLLADAGSALAASMDYDTTIQSVARLCVPTFADYCLVDIVEDDGSTRRLDAAEVDSLVQGDVLDPGSAYTIGPNAVNPVAEVIRLGLPRYYGRITEATLREARDSDHTRWLRKCDFKSAIIAPLRAGGRTLGAISFYRRNEDRTYDEKELVLAEELANRAAIAIQQARLFESAMIANRAKSDFLAVMSHELRTPLTTITGYTDLMLANVPEPLPGKHRAYVSRIRLASTHLMSLIEQILVFARLELGRERTHPERIRVADALREAAVLVEPVAADAGTRFTILPTDSDLFIETDKTKLRQILLNLLANAVKFTDKGEVSMSASTEPEHVVFTIQDTGIGIKPEHIDSIFDAFWQVDQSSTRRAGGTGLGLSVTRKLARVLGGDVTVDSKPGEGTAFHVRLPTAWAADDTEATESRTDAAG